MGSPRWLERYRDGQREQVWHELRQCGQGVREPGLDAEAQSVCDEMARRARHNIDVVVARLHDQGYRFHTNDEAQEPVQALRPPGNEAIALVPWMEETLGEIPMVVSSWLRLVGDVWLVGTHPLWPQSAAADPLVVELEGSRYPDASVRDYYEGELDAWQDWSADDPDAGGFVLPVAPDRLHKANVSGGASYGFRIPDATAEGLFIGEVAMPFVSYLNWVFRRGGFPGQALGDQQWKVRQSLAKDLLML
ncbi:MAG: hypothetical protein ABI692_01895 [Terracoccus sp.]